MLKIGIFFGGPSREREISFAGGRTVLDNLDRNLFTPVPIFVDSLGQFIQLEPHYLQYANIREFYPPHQSRQPGDLFQVYAESLGELTEAERHRMAGLVGRLLTPTELPKVIDFAFIAMHGSPGEDGSLQGLFEWLGLPYSGPGLFGSAASMDKPLQNELMMQLTGQTKRQAVLSRRQWRTEAPAPLFARLQAELGLPLVVKAPHGGSSIGVAIVRQPDLGAFTKAVNQCFFTIELSQAEWAALPPNDQQQWVQRLAHLDQSIGYPVVLERPGQSAQVCYHPRFLLDQLQLHFAADSQPVRLTATDSEEEVLFEEFIQGREFSCGVIEDADGRPVPLPPTGIEAEVFDFATKYQGANVLRKTLPVNVPLPQLHEIHRQIRAVAQGLRFTVCARIDGFVANDGRVLLHDPNTIPGMSPTSLIFKQMVEIGLNPTQAITYFIRASLHQRTKTGKRTWAHLQLLQKLDAALAQQLARLTQRTKVAVIFGGFDAPHAEASMPVARKLYSRLAASTQYWPVPVLLSGTAQAPTLHRLPVNLLYKENLADLQAALHAEKHPLIQECIADGQGITEQFAGGFDQTVEALDFAQLAQLTPQVQLAFHHHPGELPQLQAAGLKVITYLPPLS
ncbi:MAG: D-alanine--D-alanine ligase [Bernardetiaceae bacterium]|jgi:D-alanine-D-alanine ligase|nr:D-alanine--D-alanine ligase [Bernardetiaceae bacterium]